MVYKLHQLLYESRKIGRPVLIGTASVQESEGVKEILDGWCALWLLPNQRRGPACISQLLM